MVGMENLGAASTRTVQQQDRVGAPHSSPIDVVIAGLATDAERGLDGPRAAERLDRYGPNQLTESPPVPIWRRFLDQFKALVIWLLIVAAIIAGALGEWSDTLAILAIVLLNGLLGFFQEERASRTLAALRRLSAPLAKVRRDGRLQVIPVGELVPGDIIDLEAGSSVPADARLVQGFGLRVSGGSSHRRVRARGEGLRPVSLPRRRPWATAATWFTRVRSLPRARDTLPWWQPGWRPSWGGSPACSNGRFPIPRRCRGGWPSWAECWL